MEYTFSSHAISVSDINRHIKSLLDCDVVLEDVFVRGELSNISRPASGHVYFTLKDDISSLKCVMWRTAALAFSDQFSYGASVIVHGKISIYERDGTLQLYADSIQPEGMGKLYEAFLRIKEKLEKEGLFALERKKPIPAFPGAIGIVTSASGAALQDMLRVIQARWAIAEVILSPAAVQGEEAPASLLHALLRLIDAHPDVILIGRGGGSLEDLWAFNDEQLARAVADCPIPIISGVGHETDFTLVDFAADLRAPTPTAAAVLATPDRVELMQTVDQLSFRLNKTFVQQIQVAHDRLSQFVRRIELAAPWNKTKQERQKLAQLQIRLAIWRKNGLLVAQQRLQGLAGRLAAMNPEAVLRRGFALIEDQNGKVISSISRVELDQLVRIRLSDGAARAVIKEKDDAG